LAHSDRFIEKINIFVISSLDGSVILLAAASIARTALATAATEHHNGGNQDYGAHHHANQNNDPFLKRNVHFGTKILMHNGFKIEAARGGNARICGIL
jgi:hypothetical protein